MSYHLRKKLGNKNKENQSEEQAANNKEAADKEFDNLFNTLETKETDKGVKIHSPSRLMRTNLYLCLNRQSGLIVSSLKYLIKTCTI